MLFLFFIIVYDHLFFDQLFLVIFFIFDYLSSFSIFIYFCISYLVIDAGVLFFPALTFTLA